MEEFDLLRVLIVEDSEDDTQLILRELRRGGFQPEWQRVESADAFSEALQMQHWDIILSDFRMPNFVGHTALSLLKDEGKDIPFIVISGSIGEETAVELMRDGAVDFLLKNSLKRLVPVVRRELREAANRKQRLLAEKEAENSREREAHLNALLNSIRNINKLIVREKDRQLLINEVCDLLVSSRGFLGAWIMLEGLQRKEWVHAQAGFSDEVFQPMVEKLKSGGEPACYKIAMQDGERVRALDWNRECKYCPLVQNRTHGGNVVMNLVHADIHYGILCVSTSLANPYDDHEQMLLCEIADDISLALHGIEMDEKRVQVEMQLRNERKQMQQVIEAGGLGTWIWDIEANEVTVNERYVEMMGYTLEELSPYTFETWGQLVHPEDMTNANARLENCLAGIGNLYECETRMQHKDGRWVWVIATGRVMQWGENGEPKTMFGTHMDITQIKEVENQLLISERELRSAQKISNIGNWTLDLATNEVQWSSQLYKMYELDPKNGPPPFPEHQKMFTPESWEKLSAAINKTIELGVPYELEVEFLRKDDSKGWMWVRGEAVKGEEGKVVRLRGVAQDITDRRLMEIRMKEIQRLDAVGQLAGGVAHDFNNLLQGIMGYTDLCCEMVGKDHPVREYLDIILKEANRSAGIVRQLLAFSRKQTISPRVLDLNDIVESMFKMLRRLIGEDVELVWRPGKNLKAIEIDPGQMDQILANLCVNARDAIGGVGSITIETAKIMLDSAFCASRADITPGEFLVLAVTDDGCGMSEETKSSIFDPFFTTKAEGEGTGLGLATVYGIVKQNKGSIEVYSEPGEGSAFRIYLPCSEKSTEVDSPNDTKRTREGGDEVILLVEDEKAIRDVSSKILKELGYTILTAASPMEALEIMDQRSSGVDLLITDVVMPGMNGKQLAEELSAKQPGLKVLFVSGYTADVIADRGVLHEGVTFLSKPFSVDELAHTIRKILNG